MATGNGHYEGRSTADCAAHDLKDLMSKVMDQIADADRRNGDLLRQMQDRLHTLGQQTRATRPSVPAEYLPGFDRIEDGMSLLAHRIAETYSARGNFVGHAHPAASVGHEFQPVASPAMFQAQEQPRPALHTQAAQPVAEHGPAVDGTHTQPLRSSNAGVAAPRNGKYAASVDTFDVVESVAGNPAEPWAPDQVAALSQIYQNREALFANPATLDVADVAAHASHPAQAASRTATDHAWLEGRLTEISSRIEQSLAGVRPDQTIASIERRFSELEHQMKTALRGLATVADVSGLHLIEAHIQELNNKFDQVYAELMRLHTIEQQLETVLKRVADDRLSTVIKSAIADYEKSSGGGAKPASDVDFHGVAIAAAEAAASRVAQAQAREQQRDPSTKRVDDVHTMLTHFIEERRQGDEQTATALDTLQQAMLSLLDRVEQIGEPREADRHLAAYAPEVMAAPLRDEHMEDRWAEEAPALKPDPMGELIVPSDPIARQRADLQASAQRAAMAQRDKLKNQPAGAIDKAGLAGIAGKRAASGNNTRRLMVSGVALAVAFGVGAGALFFNMPNGAGTPSQMSELPAPQGSVATAAKPAGASTSQASLARAAAPPTQIIAKAPLTSQSEVPRSIPETVTEDLGTPGEVPEVSRVPDRDRASVARSNYAGDSSAPAPALSGIMIQGGDALPGGRRQVVAPTPTPYEAAANAIRIATNPAQTPTAAPEAGTARSVVEMPPATVGPNSLRLAAANGDPSAEFEVASRMAEGKGTDQNLTEAVRWYQRSATKGFAQAQYRLGTLFERGLGVKADLARARSWYQRAAEQGNVKAMHNLAVLSAGRSATAPDYATAAQWFTQAASFGLADSQYNLAVLTESGLGIEKDPVQAAMWFILAANAGDKEAIRRRDLMKTKIDKADLASAEHLAKTWQPQVQDKLANDARFAGESWKARQAVAQD